MQTLAWLAVVFLCKNALVTSQALFASVQPDCSFTVDDGVLNVVRPLSPPNCNGIRAVSRGITTIPSELFSRFQPGTPQVTIIGNFSLTGLTSINLSGNAITSIPSGLFDDLSNLQNLFLSDNSISSLPFGLFDNLSSLQLLALESNQISELSHGIFDKLSSVTLFRISDNPLNCCNISGYEFLESFSDPLTVAQCSNVDNNVKLSLPATGQGHFIEAGCECLATEHVVYSPTECAPNICTVSIGCEQPESTCFVHGNVNNCSACSVDHILTSEQTCDPKPCEHQRGCKTSGTGCNDEREFDCEECSENFQLTEKKTCSQLKCSISVIDGVLGFEDDSLSNCAIIEGTAKGITTIPSGLFVGKTSLTDINLRKNEISSIPAGLFDDLTNLKSLELYQNSITEIPAGLFDRLGKLTDLTLYRNLLTSLPSGIFNNLTLITDFSLGDNFLDHIPSGLFDYMPRLTKLYIRKNRLTGLPDNIFQDKSQLTELNFRGNNITSLKSGLFDNLSNLLILYFHENSISSIPSGLFQDLPRLLELNLHRNSITEISLGVFDNLSTLTRIWLKENLLSELPARIFQRLGRVTSFNIFDNPLKCCHIQGYEFLGRVANESVVCINDDLQEFNLSARQPGIFESAGCSCLPTQHQVGTPTGCANNTCTFQKNCRLSETICPEHAGEYGCVTCAGDHYLTAAKMCSPCIKDRFCDDAQATCVNSSSPLLSCSACKSGFINTNGICENDLCKSPSPGCKSSATECSDGKYDCIECLANYRLTEDKTCSQCIADKNCQSSDSHCLNSMNATSQYLSCLACKTEFELKDGECVLSTTLISVEPLCQSRPGCNISGTECSNGRYDCDECFENYHVTKEKTCARCIEDRNCLKSEFECVNKTSAYLACSSCREGATLQGRECVLSTNAGGGDSDDSNADESSSLPIFVIVLIALIGLSLLLIIIFALIYLRRKQKRELENQKNAMENRGLNGLTPKQFVLNEMNNDTNNIVLLTDDEYKLANQALAAANKKNQVQPVPFVSDYDTRDSLNFQDDLGYIGGGVNSFMDIQSLDDTTQIDSASSAAPNEYFEGAEEIAVPYEFFQNSELYKLQNQNM